MIKQTDSETHPRAYIHPQQPPSQHTGDGLRLPPGDFDLYSGNNL
jgi:hypothetical protein